MRRLKNCRKSDIPSFSLPRFTRDIAFASGTSRQRREWEMKKGSRLRQMKSGLGGGWVEDEK